MTSSLLLDLGATGPRSARRTYGDVLAERGTDVMLGVAVAVLAIALLLAVPHDFNVDSWLALVTGRAVWLGGIPHRNLLTAIPHHTRWTDEQWLSQLASYAIYRLGGLGLLGVVNVALLIGPIAGSVAIARRRGASFLAVVATIGPCVCLIAPSREIRTQEFAVPLFAALIWLISADARGGARINRVYWCLPILVLWANLHGSVTLGAGLVVLYAATLLWERRTRLRTDFRAWRRPLLLGAGAVLAILITPYGLGIVEYYRTTLFDSSLRHYVTEWRPITTKLPLTVVWLALSGLAAWSFVRSPRRTVGWEQLGLLILALGALQVMRNALFFGLFGLMVVPPALGTLEAHGDASARSPAGARRRILINGACVGFAAAGLLGATVAALLRSPASIIDAGESPALISAVRHETSADPSLHVIADDHYADLLLWADPGLAGRLAVDARFELLGPGQLAALSDFFKDSGPHPLSFAQRDRLVVLDRAADPGGVTALLAEPGRRVLYRDPRSLVILRSAREASR
jgi:hypothetical protein